MTRTSLPDPVGPDAFLSAVPVFSTFAQIADPATYTAVPDDWVLGLADVVSSTGAIAAGRYKSVNMAGASVISGVANALGTTDFPFVFGGDGASYVVPPDWSSRARTALAASATFAREELGLELRIGEVTVREVRAAGHDVRMAWFAASDSVSYAMFTGGGLAWAEERMKAGDFVVPPAPAGSRPDLTGLSCRFDEIPSRRGTILSLIARPAQGGDMVAYRAAIEDVLALVEASADRARPVPETGPPARWPPPGAELEARASRAARGQIWPKRLAILALSAFANLIFRFGIRVGGFEPRRYIAELVANSDYRKYDDGLRMTIDCTPDLADAIEARLAEAARSGVLVHGLHRQKAALLTCFTPSVTRSDHVHFVDGAMGGYAAAATALKAGPAE